jgi:hypothetical protein
MKDHPNMDFVLFVLHPGNSLRMALAGGALLIETMTAENHKALVIRGFNPTNKLLFHADGRALFDEFADYAKGIASARGAQYVLIPDDALCGIAATNRTVLFDYIKKGWGRQIPGQDLIDLAQNHNTTFNGQNIADRCVVVRGCWTP